MKEVHIGFTTASMVCSMSLRRASAPAFAMGVQYPGPEDLVNVRILRPGFKAQDEGEAGNHGL